MGVGRGLGWDRCDVEAVVVGPRGVNPGERLGEGGPGDSAVSVKGCGAGVGGRSLGLGHDGASTVGTVVCGRGSGSGGSAAFTRRRLPIPLVTREPMPMSPSLRAWRR